MIKGIKKTDYIFSLYILFGLIIFVLLIYNVRLSNEDIKSIVEIVLNTSSITMGFFATVFTFIFGFKDNYIHKEIMKSNVEKRQYKFLNICIIVMGFLQIIVSFIVMLLLTIKNSQSEAISKHLNNLLHFNLTQVSFYFVLTLFFVFFLFFATYLLLILSMIFKSNDSNNLPQKKMPSIKNNKV